MAAEGVGAADDTVTATLRSDRTIVDEAGQVRLTLTVAAPAGTQLEFTPIDGSIGPFELVYQTEGGAETLGGGRSRWQRTYRLQPRQAGVHVVQPVMVEATVAGQSAPTSVATSPLTVIVTPALSADADLMSPRTIAQIVAVSAPPLPWWWIAGAAAGLLAAVLLVIALVRLVMRRPRRAAIAVPTLSAHAAALAALAEIRRQGLIEAGRSNEFHIRLSQILRSFVEARFDARALTRTTEEFVAAATEIAPLDGERGDRVVRLLQRCDLAKFARMVWGPAPMREALETAEGFVNDSAGQAALVPEANRLRMR